MRTKIEKRNFETFLSRYDIICLSEIRTCLSVLIPGYVSCVNYDIQNSNRGGICVLVRLCLDRYIYDVYYSCVDQIWFKLNTAPGVLFGSCYIQYLLQIRTIFLMHTCVIYKKRLSTVNVITDV